MQLLWYTMEYGINVCPKSATIWEGFSHQCDMCRNFYSHLWRMLVKNGSYRNTDNTISI